jgi:hypothetical protein
MYDIIFTIRNCPDEALARESNIGNDIRNLPLLARLCESAVLVGAKGNHCGRQILSSTNLVEA